MSTREESARYEPQWEGEEPTIICDPGTELKLFRGCGGNMPLVGRVVIVAEV